MRVERLKRKRKRKNRLIQIIIFSLFLVMAGFVALQSGYTKEEDIHLAHEDRLAEETAPKVLPEGFQPEGKDGKDDRKKAGSNADSKDPANNSKKDNDQGVKGSAPATSQKGADKGDVTGKIIYLTFDDGPYKSTMDILDLLDKYEMKATFFMLEPSMRAYAKELKEITERGHAVGSHSVTHDKNKFYASAKSAVNEMKTAQKTLNKITGIQSGLIRVPYGSVPNLKPAQKKALEQSGFQIWDWNIDSKDWKYPDGSFVNYTIKQIENFDKNEPMIVLLHDKITTAKSLEKLLIYLKKNNFETEVLNTDMAAVQFRG